MFLLLSGKNISKSEAFIISASKRFFFNPKNIKLKKIPGSWENITGNYGIPGREEKIKTENGYLILENSEGKRYLEKIDEYKYQIHGGSRDGAMIIFRKNEIF